MRRAAAGLVIALCAAVPTGAHARTAATLDAGVVYFFSDTLALVGRGGATLQLADGTLIHGDAAYVDLKNDRAVVAGDARASHRTATINADAIAVDLDTDRIDLLEVTTGVSRTTHSLVSAEPAEVDAQRFAFPDVDDRYAYIKSRRAAVTLHANVRFTPAAFPTSVGAVPVPSYLDTFATSAGFGTTTLPGAVFDQPYGLFGTPTSLTSVHARFEQGPGATLALEEQLSSGDDGYVTTAFNAPIRGTGSSGINAYRRMGSRYTFQAGASSQFGFRTANASIGAAFGNAGARTTYSVSSGGFSQFDTSLRTPDVPLLHGATFRLTGDIGFDAHRGGGLAPYSLLPDALRYGIVWRHGLAAFLASPIVRAPFGSTLGVTLRGSRTWYAFPHRLNTIDASANLSKRLTPSISLFAGYDNAWISSVFPGRQRLFYPIPSPPFVTPDGTPYLGYGAYNGTSVSRAANFDVQIAPPRTSTSVRISLRHYVDFIQFNGIGRPPWEVRGDATFRPFPNIGIAMGRSYDFDWAGRRWVPGWNFAITQ
jgi:hypothetical protein